MKRSAARKLLRLLIVVMLFMILFGYGAASVMGAYYFTTNPNRVLSGATPANVGIYYFRDIEFSSANNDGTKLRGWFVPRQGSKRVLILAHGKHGDRTFGLNVARQLWNYDYNLLMFDFRGHGASDGKYYTYGYHEQHDVVGAVNWLRREGFDGGQIGAIGWSMGAASTLLAMGQTPYIKAAVIDSAYGDLGRVVGRRLGMSAAIFPGLTLSGRFLLNFDPADIKPESVFGKLGDRKVFLIHGDRDSTVPVEETLEIQKAGGSHIASTWILPGVEHAAAFQAKPTEYFRWVVGFFDRELS
jgi:uncharacterized protein